MMNEAEFTDYCWDFYGPGNLYGHFFNNNLTRSELKLAVTVRIKCGDGEHYAADSLDREAIRDIILQARGEKVMGL